MVRVQTGEARVEWRRDKKSISGRIIFNRNMDKGLFKVMLAGDVSTGKTSFLTQLIYQTAERNPVSTQTLSFFALKLTNPDANLQLWDSPGDPRHHYQVVSSLAPFQALLIFVDITNTHTQDCAITLLEQVRCYPSLQVHIVQAKQELTRKDPLKRKVPEAELQTMASRVGGCLFSYSRDEPVEPILQKVLEWKRAAKTEGGFAEEKKVKEQSCDCQVY